MNTDGMDPARLADSQGPTSTGAPRVPSGGTLLEENGSPKPPPKTFALAPLAAFPRLAAPSTNREQNRSGHALATARPCPAFLAACGGQVAHPLLTSTLDIRSSIFDIPTFPLPADFSSLLSPPDHRAPDTEHRVCPCKRSSLPLQSPSQRGFRQPHQGWATPELNTSRRLPGGTRRNPAPLPATGGGARQQCVRCPANPN